MGSIRTVRAGFSSVAWTVLVLLGCGAAASPEPSEDPDSGAIPIDEDGDGWAVPEDCDDGDATIHPGAPDDDEIGPWRQRPIAGADRIARPSIAVEAGGAIHVGWVADGDLVHASIPGSDSAGPWARETVWSSDDPILATRIAVDASNVVHVAWDDWRHTGFRYAQRTGMGWTDEVVDVPEEVAQRGQMQDLVVDTEGAAVLVFGVGGTRLEPSRIFFATRTDAGWGADATDTGRDDSSLRAALDPEGAPRVAYLAGGIEAHVLREVEGRWRDDVVEEPEPDSIAFGHPPIGFAIGPDGTSHVAFPRLTADLESGWTDVYELRIVSSDGDEWTRTVTVDPAFVVGCLDLATDSDGEIHVSYAESEGLRYATNANRPDGAWVMETVEEVTGSNAMACSLAVDADGVAHLVFVREGEADSQELVYATNRIEPDGIDQDCDDVDG